MLIPFNGLNLISSILVLTQHKHLIKQNCPQLMTFTVQRKWPLEDCESINI